MRDVEFLTFQDLHDFSEGEQCLQYLFDQRIFVVDKLPDYGALVPKHVAVATWYEVCFVICFIAF